MRHISRTAWATLLLLSVASLANAGPWYAKGDYYAGTGGLWGFDGGNELFDDGAHGDGAAGDGIFGGTVTSDQAAGRKEFKIALDDWSASYPSCNSWLHSSGSGDAIHFTFDTNTYNDGWLPKTNIVWSDHYAPGGTTFEVMGSATETGAWSTGVAATLSGGLWELEVEIAQPNTHEAKFRATGTWDICNIGSESNAPCGANLSYTTTVPKQKVRFQFNPTTGRARAEIVPTGRVPAVSPFLMGLLALALLGAAGWAFRARRAATT